MTIFFIYMKTEEKSMLTKLYWLDIHARLRYKIILPTVVYTNRNITKNILLKYFNTFKISNILSTVILC